MTTQTNPALFPPLSGSSPVEDTFTSIQAINEQVRHSSAWLGLLRQEMAKVVIGQEHLIERLLGVNTSGFARGRWV